MKILVFGSFNIDKVYSLPYLPEKGESLRCENYEIHVGGKGLNQALAFKKAGADVFAAGKIGKDGRFLTDFLGQNGVDISLMDFSGETTGHTIIEVDPEGQNQMILFGGANMEITEEYCDEIIKKHPDCDLIMTEYETSSVEYMLSLAHKAGIKTAVNPSPYTEKLKNFPYNLADYIILNEFEGKSITGLDNADDICDALYALNKGIIILTLGAEGSVYYDGSKRVSVPAFKVNAVDTTGAGDTFTGYCLSRLLSGDEPEKALRIASAASALEVTKPGAAQTIPDKEEVEKFLEEIG